MKRLLIIFAGLVLTTTDHAAGFDCAKAGTKVEHLICDNPEISKLDDELAASYRAALLIQSQEEALKQAQKRWIKERNECMDAACVQSAYRKRVDQLHSSLHAAAQTSTVGSALQITQSSGVISNHSAVAKKYPPYPDFWQWESQDEPNQLVLVSNGDVLADNFLLFGGQSVTSGEFRHIKIGQFEGMLNLSDGTKVSGLKEGNLFGLIKLSNGLEVYGVDNSRVDCYHGPLQHFLRVINNKKDEATKVIFILLDKPERHIWDRPRAAKSDEEVSSCPEEGPPGYTTRVEAVTGGGMLPLDDGTFLLPMRNGLIVRFDEHLNTKSPLINRRFFVFDLNEMLNSNYSGLFIDQINGKKYNLKKTGYQPVYDDLYKYLTSIRGK